ncbi:MAG: hypothetical protein U9P81_05775 [Euryarchaeota archaeon]|nr:hypothetical protein [Euryarchaeota archaeon]
MRGKLIRRKKRQQTAAMKDNDTDEDHGNDDDHGNGDDYGNWENVFTQEKQKTTVNNLTLQIDDIQIHKGRVGNSILLKLNDVILTCELADPEKIKLFDEAATGED